MKNTRMSRITEHSQYQKTDQLYQPLRQALVKSSTSKQKPFNRILSPRSSKKQLKTSLVSHNMRSLSPKQAQEMQKNIYIPTSRRLVPTHELEKVRGKKFEALDVNVHYNAPISAAEFQRIKKNPKVQETVYSLSSALTSQQMSGKQTPIRNEPLVWQGNGHPINNLEGQVGGKNQQIVWEGNGHIVGNPEVGYMEEKKQASPPKLKSGVNFGESQFGNIEESKIIRQEQSVQGQLFGNYDNYSLRSNRESQVSQVSRANKAKQKYKYNLFSAFDEGVNTKCGTCMGDNEVIASKPNKDQPWS